MLLVDASYVNQSYVDVVHGAPPYSAILPHGITLPNQC